MDLLNQVADLFAEPVEHAGFGLAHGGGADAKFGGHTSGWLPSDCDSPGNTPGSLFKFIADQVESAMIDAADGGGIRFVVGSRVHDTGVYRPKHSWQFEGGIAFKSADARHNVPAPIAEAIESAKKKR